MTFKVMNTKNTITVLHYCVFQKYCSYPPWISLRFCDIRNSIKKVLNGCHHKEKMKDCPKE